MNERKKIAIKFILVIFIYFITAMLSELLFLNFRNINEENVNGFLLALEDSKAYSRYFNNFRISDFCIDVPYWQKVKCFSVKEKLIKIEQNDKLPKIILDNRALEGLIRGSFNPKEVIFSEFIFGHIKLENFDIFSGVMLWKK